MSAGVMLIILLGQIDRSIPRVVTIGGGVLGRELLTVALKKSRADL